MFFLRPVQESVIKRGSTRRYRKAATVNPFALALGGQRPQISSDGVLGYQELLREGSSIDGKAAQQSTFNLAFSYCSRRTMHKQEINMHDQDAQRTPTLER